MKRIAIILACMSVLGMSVSLADNAKPVQVTQLPAVAQQFIRQYFASCKVALAKVETELMSKSYEVVFTNGDHIEFDSKGNWEEIDCKSSSVPVSIIPAPVAKYIRTNYPDATVSKIEKDRKQYEVKLSNGVELTFDSKYNLVDIDR